MTTPNFPDDWRPWAAERLSELATGIAFSTRLPLARAAPISGAAIAQAVWALPVAGVVVGIIGAVVYALAYRLGLPSWSAAALAVAATLAATGCLHEDGLADTADGFGGGKTRERKLDIMRDSQIGTYGVCALALSILLRASALASLDDPGLAAAALIAAHCAARATMPVLMFFVPPARSDGLSFDVGQPQGARAIIAAALGIIALVAGLGITHAVAAAVVLAIVVALMARLSLRQIGGQTGDVLGALEQVSEIVILLVAARSGVYS
ncbi:MAG TPA: adenosylcobinamide-GDP ribazoletransferase [Xanthobacteraceae bacterium]|nr:adenosylcobinamide-GDP ribazoletransferase [Xanthobacteraceae bacterium]